MNKERHIYIGIIIFLIATLATTLVLFTQFDNETWREVATTFIFPFIYTIIGAIVVAVVGTIIADKVLENYNKRLSYGLSKRVIQLLGYPVFSDRIEHDLHRSALMKNEIIPNRSTVSHSADLDDSQALIVLTVGKLDDSAQITKDLKERRFSTIVNAQGRVLSDIHSLLTTLPPRNDE